jgi:hypothetical protein
MTVSICAEATFSLSASNVRLPGIARSSVWVCDLARVNWPRVCSYGVFVVATIVDGNVNIS